MPDRVPPALGRQCPSCGRRVPSKVAKCRCGAVLPAFIESAEAEETPKSASALPTLIVLALIVAGAGYWTLFVYDPPQAATPVVPGSQDPGPHYGSDPAPGAPAASGAPAAPVAPVAPAATTPRRTSAEQAAWMAQASQPEPERATSPAGAMPAATPIPPVDRAPVAPPSSLEDMIDRAMPSIVLVETSSGRGSAFFVTYDTLITNVHVVQQDSNVTLRKMDGSSVTARVHQRAPAFDIAVLKVSTPSSLQPFLAMGTSSSLKPGQEVVVIGSALGTLQNSVSRGIVSGLRNSGGVTLVQSDAAANPGNSGGPMLDRNGRVVGILTAGMRGQEGLNFAVSIDHARDILEGRQTNLGSGQPGLANIRPSAPGETESDRTRQLGEQQFRQRMDGVVKAVEQLDSAWQQFRSQCYKNPIPGVYDREWFAVFSPGAIPGNAAAGCMSYYQEMTGEMQKFKTYMRQAIQDARRASLLPGMVRDELRARKLTLDWER